MRHEPIRFFFFFFNDTATTEIYTLSLHDALPISPLAALGDILSTWIIAPLMFLFLLRDTGEIKRGLLRAVPNRLFEPVLNVLADLDRALGDYLRGLFLESCLLGLTVMLLLTIIGVPLRWTIAIGIFTAPTNVIPDM